MAWGDAMKAIPYYSSTVRYHAISYNTIQFLAELQNGTEKCGRKRTFAKSDTFGVSYGPTNTQWFLQNNLHL